MSARAVITMSPEQYLAGLKQLESATAKSSNKMENSFKDYGTAINKAGIAMRYMSAEMGAGAVAFGRAFQVLAGGKIAIAVAAVAGAFTALKKIWDELTVSSDEYRQKVDAQVESNDKNLDSMRKTQSEEDAMLERLQELAKRENKTNEETDEQIRLAEILAGKYGKLGIGVDSLTGDYASLLDVMKKINDAQKAERASALENQINTIQSRIGMSAKEGIVGGFGSQMWDFLKRSVGVGAPVSTNDIFDYYNSLSAENKLGYAKSMLDPSNSFGAKTESDISFWKSQQAELEKLVDLTERLNKLRESGSETDKEANEARKKASEESRKAADERDAADKARVAELNEEAKLQEEIDRKHGEALQKEFEKEQQILAERKKGAELRRTNDIASLRGMALRRLGRDEEADIEEALYAETQAQGAPLDEATRADLIARVKARRALSAAMETSTSPELYAPRVNSLIARGGSSAPVKMPEVEKLQNKQLDATNKTNQIAQRILNQVDSWNTI